MKMGSPDPSFLLRWSIEIGITSRVTDPLGDCILTNVGLMFADVSPTGVA
jgi:hypothetical protein